MKIDASEAFEDWTTWENVKPGDKVSVTVNGRSSGEMLVWKNGAMGLLKSRTLEKIKGEATRQLEEALRGANRLVAEAFVDLLKCPMGIESWSPERLEEVANGFECMGHPESADHLRKGYSVCLEKRAKQ